ncbi:MAG: glutathione S-transferase N-terminal domain-containing protein [Candidatus Binataceae bacterium]|nr:glutathione S-transferase N-terminal domain-containing protein [Candidatus Binataceae bacterium]
MLKLYYSPGACSMASHIGIEESGAPYEAKPTLIPKNEQKSEAYLKINPRGKVPALQLDDNSVITENVSILNYIAKRFPDKKLMLTDPLGESRCLTTMAWFSNTVHPSFTACARPERFAEDPAAQVSVKETSRKNFFANCREIDSLLTAKEWMMGSQFTVCDGYALIFYGWGARVEMPMKELKNYTAFKDRMLQRPAVRKILEREQNILLNY